MKLKLHCWCLIAVCCAVCSTAGAQVSVTGATSGNTTYTTLRGAFGAINATAQANNNIIITISSDVNEGTQTAQLNAGTWTTLTIVPSGPRTISGTSTAGNSVIFLNGADNVIIDGLNTGGNSLRIVNTSTSTTGGTSTIRFNSDAVNNTILNCTVTGSAASASAAVILFGSGTTSGNDNNTITGCTIQESSAGLPVNAIASLPGALPANDNITISNNNISNYFGPAVSSYGVYLNANNSAWNISGNRFFQTAARTPGENTFHRAIFINTPNGGGYTLNNNIIGYGAADGTGTTTYQGTATSYFSGIYLTSSTTPSSIQGNTITAIRHSATASGTFPGMFSGITVQGGAVNVGNINGNTIGSATGNNAIVLTAATAADYRFTGLYVNATGTSSAISNNTIAGISTAGTATAAYSVYPVYVAGAVNYTIANNTVGSTATANSIAVGTNALTSGICSFYGIYTSGTANSSITGNTVQNCSVYGSGASFYNGIFVFSGAGTVTVSANTIADATLYSSSTSSTNGFRGIYSQATVENLIITDNVLKRFTAATDWFITFIDNTGAVTGNITMNNNQLGSATDNLLTYTVASPGALRLINNGGGASTAALSIQGNSFFGINYPVNVSGPHNYISNAAATLSQSISNNTFNNLTAATSGNVVFLSNNVALSATGTQIVSGNAIVGGFSKTVQGNSVVLFNQNTTSAAGASITNTNNNFSNITVSGNTTLIGWQQQDTGNTLKTIGSNTFSNWNAGSTNITALLAAGFGNGSSISGNTISGITSQNNITGLELGASGNAAALTVSGNTVTGLTSIGTGNNVTGFTTANNSPQVNIFSNTVNNLSSTGSSSAVSGLRVTAGTGTTNVYQNTVNTLSGTGTGFASVNGILVSGGTTVNLYRNKVADLSEAATATGAVVTGIALTGGTAVTAYNNVVGELRAPATTATFPVRGIAVASATENTQYNLYYNTVYLTASSTGATFGSAGVYHTASASATVGVLNLRNNIIVNLSQRAGAGRTVALYRSAATLANYASSSNNNLFYAGVAGANNLLYFDSANADQSLATFTARVAPREASSVSGNPEFLSTSWGSPVFLRPNFNSAATGALINDKGIAISTVTNDYLGAVRSAVPDLGAYEGICSYTSTLYPAGPVVICAGSSQTLTVTTNAPGATYVWRRNGEVLSNTTSSLTVTQPGLYDVLVTDGITFCESTTNTVPVSNATTTWNGSWTNGLPSASTAVIFEADFTATSDIEACSIVVNNGADVFIQSGRNVIVNGFVNVANGTFTLADNANLVQLTDAVNSGNISVIKNSSPVYRLDYTLWSSPVAGQNLRAFSPQTLADRFYTYNTATDTYVTVNPETANFDTGRGYLIRVANNHPAYVNPAAPGTIWTGTFTGVPHNGNYSVPVSAAGNGYNAVGNPYPSPINVYDFIDQNNPALADVPEQGGGVAGGATLYFWRKTNNYLMPSYATLTKLAYNANSAAGGDTAGTAFNGPAGEWVINSGQGFIVQATGSSIQFNNTMRRTVTNGQFFRMPAVAGDTDVSRLWFNLVDAEGQYIQTTVGYTGLTTNGFDYGWDGRLLDEGGAAFYSANSNTRLAIQARAGFSADDVVPLGYRAASAGSYTITLSKFDGVFAVDQDVYLADTETGMVVNLKEGPYQFSTAQGSFDSRFHIRYAVEALGIDEASGAQELVAYKEQGVIKIKGYGTTITAVSVYDVQGRLIAEKNGLEATEVSFENLQAQRQVLLIVIDTPAGKLTRKILY